MATTSFHPSIATNYIERTAGPSIISKFMNWCKGQEDNRLLWLGIALTSHGCILTPLTVMAVLLAGTNLTLFILALVSMSIALVTNLAALPTRITIPTFLFSILMDVVIVIVCAVHGFSLSNTF